MGTIRYNLEFKGQVAQVKEGLFHAVSTAASSTISTVVSPSGVREKAAATRGGKAYFESDVTITGEDTFQEKGRIKFGPRQGRHARRCHVAYHARVRPVQGSEGLHYVQFFGGW